MSVFTPKTVALEDGSEVLLRSPRVADAQALLDYLVEVRRETDGIMQDPEDSMPSKEDEQRLIDKVNESDSSLILLAEIEDQIIAWADIIQPRFVRQQHMAVLGISIRNRWHGRGLGGLMSRELIDWARSHPGLDLLTLSVFADNNRAIGLYRKVGFQHDGLLPRRAKVNGKYRDMVVMSLGLDGAEVSS